MNHLNTIASTIEQARQALLLLGAPAPARLMADVHAALFDGDLDVPALAGLVAAEEPVRTAALRRAAALDETQRLFGLPTLPHQRGHG